MSIQCLVFDIVCEYKNGSKEDAKKMLYSAAKKFSIEAIRKEINEHHLLNLEELSDITSAVLHVKDRKN